MTQQNTGCRPTLNDVPRTASPAQQLSSTKNLARPCRECRCISANEKGQQNGHQHDHQNDHKIDIESEQNNAKLTTEQGKQYNLMHNDTFWKSHSFIIDSRSILQTSTQASVSMDWIHTRYGTYAFGPEGFWIEDGGGQDLHFTSAMPTDREFEWARSTSSMENEGAPSGKASLSSSGILAQPVDSADLLVAHAGSWVEDPQHIANTDERKPKCYQRGELLLENDIKED